MPDNFLCAVGEQAALGLVNKNVRIWIISLPPTIHGTGDKGFMKHVVDAEPFPQRGAALSHGTREGSRTLEVAQRC